MSTNHVFLTEEEVQTLTEFIQLIIFTETKYLVTDGAEELDVCEQIDFKRKNIERWWELYDQIIGRSCYLFEDYEFIRLLETDLQFGIFSVLYENVYDIDNPYWLYNLLTVWKKCYDCVQAHDACKVCNMC